MTRANEWVDCSSNNPIPNLAQYAAAGHTDLCRKVTEGTGYHWFEGDTVAVNAHAHNLRVGHYHWLRPDSDAAAQAEFFAASVRGGLAAGDWLMTDFERTAKVSDRSDSYRAGQLREFNTTVANALPGHEMYVYTGNWYLAGNPKMQAECRKWPIVMSDYSGAATLPNPYGLHYVAWQFTDRATVPGFSKTVDYNRWLIRPGSHPSPKPKPPAKPATPDLMEQMMALDRTSADYKNLVADIAHAVLNAPITSKVNGNTYPLYEYLQVIDRTTVHIDRKA